MFLLAKRSCYALLCASPLGAEYLDVFIWCWPPGEGEGRGGSVSDTAPDGDACMAPVSVRRPAQLTVLFSPEKDCVFGTWKAPSDDERLRGMAGQYIYSSLSPLFSRSVGILYVADGSRTHRTGCRIVPSPTGNREIEHSGRRTVSYIYWYSEKIQYNKGCLFFID